MRFPFRVSSKIHHYWPHNICYTIYFFTGSGLMLASRYPIIEASFHPHRHKCWLWQKMIPQGILVVKVDLGGQKVGYLANLHNVAYQGDEDLICKQETYFLIKSLCYNRILWQKSFLENLASMHWRFNFEFQAGYAKLRYINKFSIDICVLFLICNTIMLNTVFQRPLFSKNFIVMKSLKASHNAVFGPPKDCTHY